MSSRSSKRNLKAVFEREFAKKKNISKRITLCIQDLKSISMGCLPLGEFNERLYSDLLIQVTAILVSHRCESGPGKRIEGLKDCCDGTHSQWFY